MVDVGTDLVAAAERAAHERGRDIADVPLGAIAAAAGISRSTLLRRLGGTRAALDEAARLAGVDPGGRPPVRDRAVDAAAELIAGRGLGSLTLDAVAAAADCSLPSLHATFEGRDGLLAAVFDRYGPVPDLQSLAADAPRRLDDLIRAIYRVIVTVFGREPRVLPAIVADLFARPDGPAGRMFRSEFLPRLVGPLRDLLGPRIDGGQIRPLPLPVHLNLLAGPLIVHLLMRPGLERVFPTDLPSVDEVAEMLADAYLRAAAVE